MSLARLALRIITRLAITGRTMVEDRVSDSSIVDLEEALKDAPKPIALVYTDESEFVPVGRELWGGQGSVKLVLILAVAGVAELKDANGNGTGTVEFTFPHTDDAIEASLDIIERQIQHALMDPSNPWGQHWQGLVANVTKWTSQRGGSTKEGSRFGARQIIIECETNLDPVPGAELEGHWLEFVEALEAHEDEDTAQLAAPFRTLAEGKARPTWERTMLQYGVGRRGLKAMALEPFLFHTENGEEPATLTGFEIEGKGEGV